MAEYSSEIANRPAGRGWPRWLAALLFGLSLLLLVLLIASWFLRACAPVDPSVNLTALETLAPPPPPPIHPDPALKASLDDAADDEKKLEVELAALEPTLNKLVQCKPVEPPKPPPPPPVAKAPPPPPLPADRWAQRTSACCRAAGDWATIRRAT